MTEADKNLEPQPSPAAPQNKAEVPQKMQEEEVKVRIMGVTIPKEQLAEGLKGL